MDQANLHESASESRGMRAAAFSVHVFTALGAGVALIALLEAVREHWAAMFWWLGVALVIDAVDGPIATTLYMMDTISYDIFIVNEPRGPECGFGGQTGR